MSDTANTRHGFDQPTKSELSAILPGYEGHGPEPMRKTRPITGPVNPLPCSNPLCPGLTVLGGDDDPDLEAVLESYRGCVVRVTIELVEGPLP